MLKLPAVDLPWMDQMLYTMLITIVIIMGVSLTTSPDVDDPKGIPLTAKMFKTDKFFNVGAYTVLIITALLYAIFW